MVDKTTSILIADDLASMRKHARDVIQAFFARCIDDAQPVFYEAQSGAAAEKACTDRSGTFGLIVLDISMQDQTGIKTAKNIWHKYPGTKILFWSQYDHEAYIREIGKIVPDEAIHGYLLKSQADEVFAEALQLMLVQDLPYINPRLEKIRERTTTRGAAISYSEYETLMDICTGLTDKAIALKEHVSYRGAQNRMATLLQKLSPHIDHVKESAGMEVYNPRTRLILEAFKRGLITQDAIAEREAALTQWLFTEFGFESAQQD